MGILLNALGSLSGKVGDVVFRQRGGKTYIAKAPKRRSSYVSPESLERRKKFTAACYIAKAINAVPQLKEIWSYGGKKSNSPYNKIFKSIYLNIGKDSFTKFGSIIPDHGYRVMKCKFVQKMPKIFIELIEPHNDGEVFTESEVGIVAGGILVLSEPICDMDLPIQVLAVNSGVQKLSMEFPQTIEIGLKVMNYDLITQYKIQECHLHLFTVDAKGKVVRFSERIEPGTN